MLVLGLLSQSYSIDSSYCYLDAQKALYMSLQNEGDYEKKYVHWRGNPPVIVDYHYNALANKIVADEIVKALNECE